MHPFSANAVPRPRDAPYIAVIRPRGSVGEPTQDFSFPTAEARDGFLRDAEERGYEWVKADDVPAVE